MILSHKYKFIFIKTEKTAGTSLEIALSKFCGPEDIITPIATEDEIIRRDHGFRVAQNYRMTFRDFLSQSNKKNLRDMVGMVRGHGFPRKFWNHIPASEIRKRVDSRVWHNYTKFSIIRDPVDQTVSNYNWVRHRYAGNANLEDIASFIRTRTPRLRNNWNIVSENGHVLVDTVIRYENLYRDADRIGHEIGLPEDLSDVLLQVAAKSGYSSAPKEKDSIVTDEDIQVIKYLRREEVDFFNY